MTAINFDGKIFGADRETRTMRGLILPFGAVGNTSAGAVEFHPEAFGQIKAEEIILNIIDQIIHYVFPCFCLTRCVDLKFVHL